AMRLRESAGTTLGMTKEVPMETSISSKKFSLESMLKELGDFLSGIIAKARRQSDKEQVMKEAQAATVSPRAKTLGKVITAATGVTTQKEYNQAINAWADQGLQDVIDKIKKMDSNSRANYIGKLLSKKTMAMIRPS